MGSIGTYKYDNWTTEEEAHAHNKVLLKAGLKCFYESFVQGSKAVILLNFCAKNPRLRKAAKCYVQTEIIKN